MQVKITYCSNYNGCSVEVDGVHVDYDDPKAQIVCDAVIEFAADECSKTCGEFYGDIDTVEEVATREAKIVYGEDVEVIFEEDTLSS